MMRLYYHKTDGGAEYLCSSKVEGTENEGSFDSKYIIRIDGDITKDAELNVRGEQTVLKTVARSIRAITKVCLNTIFFRQHYNIYHKPVTVSEDFKRAMKVLAQTIGNCVQDEDKTFSVNKFMQDCGF